MREQEALGRVTASVTHEMQNSLAVIRESAGLAQDLIGLCEGLGPKQDRLLSAVKLIQEQVVRCGDLAWNLNRFAHAWEEVEGGRDLGAVLEEVLCLTRRRCASSGVKASLAPSAAPVRTSAPGLELRLAIFEAVERCLEAGPGASLTLEPATMDGRPVVRFHLERSADDSGKAGASNGQDGVLQALETSLRQSGARFEDATPRDMRFAVFLDGVERAGSA